MPCFFISSTPDSGDKRTTTALFLRRVELSSVWDYVLWGKLRALASQFLVGIPGPTCVLAAQGQCPFLLQKQAEQVKWEGSDNEGLLPLETQDQQRHERASSPTAG